MATVNLSNVGYYKFKRAVSNLNTVFNNIIANSSGSCLLMKVNTIQFNNYSASTACVGLRYFSSFSNSLVTLSNRLVIPARCTYEVVNDLATINLNEGDYLQANATVNNAISAYVQYDRISEFTSVQESLSGNVEVFIVGGGGSTSVVTGWGGHGGGGAGGVLYGVLSGAAISNNPVCVVVGAGGAASGDRWTGNPGSNSYIFALSTCYIGAGGGGGGRDSGGIPGGSGGGGSAAGGGGSSFQINSSTPPGWCGYGGNGKGGTGSIFNSYGGGGGGAGQDACVSGIMRGGNGICIFKEWACATNTGTDNGYYAGGGGAGGGGGYIPPTYGVCGVALGYLNAGGLGGGGQGGDVGPPFNGRPGNVNTGGGGGGPAYPTYYPNSIADGQAGGSGIIIFRYLGGSSGTGGNTIVTSNGYTYHTFVGSGSFTFSLPTYY